MTPTQAFALIARSQFRPFTQDDWDCWAGCDSAEPMIAYTDEFTLIIDGDVLQVYTPDDTFWQISLNVEEI